MIGSTYETRILDRLRFTAQAHVSRELLADTRLDTTTDMITDTLAVTLSKELLVDRFLEDVAEVPASGVVRTTDTARSALVELPRSWWRRILGRPARSVWCPVVGDAVIANGRNEIPVTGTATVRAEYFRTFPEAAIQYPPDLGRPRILIRTGDPYRWEPQP